MPPAVGRAGAAAGEHHNEQHKTAELRPKVEILCAVAGGGNERCDLKGRVLDGGADGPARFENKIERDERGRAEHDAGVDAQLVAAQDLPPAPCTGQKQKCEIDRRDEHEDHDDPVDRRGLVVGDAFVADGEAAGRDGRERGGHRVEPRYPRRAERERFRRREENVDAVKHFGRVVRARQQLGGDGAGAFGLHQVDAALAERHFFKRAACDERVFFYAVYYLGIPVEYLNAVLGMGVNYVVAQVVDRLCGIVARDHDKVRGVEVDRDAGRAERVKKLLERRRGLGCRLDGERSVEAVREAGELKARILHYLVSLVSAVLGNNADVCRDDIRAELLCKLDYPLRLLDSPPVFVPVAEASAEVAAEGGDDEPVVLNEPAEIRTLRADKLLGRHLAAGGIDLNALRTDLGCLSDRRRDIRAEAVNNNAYWKFHVSTVL